MAETKKANEVAKNTEPKKEATKKAAAPKKETDKKTEAKAPKKETAKKETSKEETKSAAKSAPKKDTTQKVAEDKKAKKAEAKEAKEAKKAVKDKKDKKVAENLEPKKPAVKEANAVAKYVRMSPIKLKPVADLVRGKDLEEALTILKFTPGKGAELIERVVQSAAANAENNFDLETEKLFVAKISADYGPTMKRWRAGAQGRASMILKRTSNISVTLAEKE